MIFKFRADSGAESTNTSDSKILRNIIISIFIAINLMGVNIGYNDEVSNGGAIPAVGWISFALTSVIFILLGRLLLLETFHALSRRSVVIELPFVTGIIGAILLSAVNLISGKGAIYFDTAGILLVVYTIGKWVGARVRLHAIDQSRNLISSFDSVYIKRTVEKGEVPVSADQIREGDRVLVRSSQVIPADGIIESGATHVGETFLTGEHLPKAKAAGDAVYAGTKAYDGDILMRVSATGEATRIQAILKSSIALAGLPSRWTNQANRLVAWFFPLVLFIAAGAVFFWGARVDSATGLMNGLSVLLIACPCAMGLATPIMLWAGIGAYARAGIGVRDPEAIEKLCEVNYVVFDKTGTLTQVSLDDSDILMMTGFEKSRALASVAALEAITDHPYARVFSRYQARGLMRADANTLTPLPGVGISGIVFDDSGSLRVDIGNEGLLVSGSERQIAVRSKMRGSHLRELYVKLDGQLAAVALLRETVVTDTDLLFSKIGIPGEILTGDPSPRARELFRVCYRGGRMPQEKSERISELRANGHRVLYVGDGLNDTPAMARSDVSIAISAPGSLPADAASFTLSGNQLEMIPMLRSSALLIRGNIRGNLLWAATYNLVGIFVAAAGRLDPVFAAILMTGSSVFVSWRAHQLRQKLLDVFAIKARNSSTSKGLPRKAGA
ncbi:MAG: hypothetical protein A2X94_13090 [Bdellovibrionales bacterium GWB1_55_8]|nr:MAG: hypothetical protein A2X94_13090 [Bdellovibrionales bacterium GWB1_55_8]